MATYSSPVVMGRSAPLHAILIPFGAALLVAALVTDVLYVKTVSTQWETFSIWLITGGLIIAAISALALLVDIVSGATRRIAWRKFGLFALAVVLSTVNAFVHSRDGYTAVVPSGIILSAIVTVLLVAGAWGGWSLNARMHEERR